MCCHQSSNPHFYIALHCHCCILSALHCHCCILSALHCHRCILSARHCHHRILYSLDATEQHHLFLCPDQYCNHLAANSP
uniref:Uncharacterized protein n=1 Tax=Arundo donax TaxID=35708 RepID=A0A0A8YI63_ARUDO